MLQVDHIGSTVYLEEEEDTMDSSYCTVLESLDEAQHQDYSQMDEFVDIVPRKRKRFGQLTWEEKIQQKKLRNRIAAQTSRDRKKARMDYLEEAVQKLDNQNKTFQKQIEELQQKNDELSKRNTELTKALSSRPLTCSCATRESKQEKANGLVQSCVNVDLPQRPAESFDPQQKGLGSVRAHGQKETPAGILWKVVALFLLSRRSSAMTLPVNSNDWRKLSLENWDRMTEKDWELWRMRCEPLAEKKADVLLEWWGKHQKSWNPMGAPCPA